MKANVFCLIGKSGSGKSTYLDRIMKLTKVHDEMELIPLVYSTTRSKREGEIDGKDYHFRSREYYSNLVRENDLIETRCYNILNDTVFYFTETGSIEEGKNYITAASIEQIANYARSTYPMNVYMIYLDCPLMTRFDRIYHDKNRIKNEKDLLELCRRSVKEIDDYSDNSVWDIINENIHERDRLIINNDSGIILNANVMFIYEWIWQKLV